MRRRLAMLPLAWPLARRDIAARYRGSMVGVGWALLAPLAMVAIYASVFQGVFKVRWAGSSEAAGGFDYAARLFVGLTVFTAVAEVASRATRLMQDNANLVKRVVFPLELLCVALVLQVAVHTALQMLVVALLLVATGAGPQWSWLWLPRAWSIALQLALALGLAALGCYLRDLQQMVPLVMSGLMFLSPVFYPHAAAPEVLQALLQFNPMTAPIELARAAWFGDAVNWSPVLLSLAGLLVALPLAHLLFRRLRPGFADLV